MDQSNTYSAWNPGLESDIPPAWLDLETIHRSENVYTKRSDVMEISKFTGLPPEELVSFRPVRLALHEVIVRVNANLVLSEGKTEEELGFNFRQIANTVLHHYVLPHTEEIKRTFNQLREEIQSVTEETLDHIVNPPESVKPIKKQSFLDKILGRKNLPEREKESRADREFRLINELKQSGLSEPAPLKEAVYKSLYRILGRISSHRGYIGNDKELLTRLVIHHVCNHYGSQVIGNLITPWVEQAFDREKFARLPDSEKPFLISLKGASASGKSSLRAMLPSLIRKKGMDPHTFGTISPDIWRKFLLDYESLDIAFKYFGRMTSQEVIIVDGKLDRYIRAKARRNHSVPNLLVDRFRFDSFTSENISRILHDTYARYVDTMHMYFVVTPPEATVERGWERGLERGRFKSVEDFLDHSLEASIGMPKILFKWLAHKDFNYYFEFLDNNVAKGTYPATIATGTSKKMFIYRPMGLVNLERYQKINIQAKSVGEVYPDDSAMALTNNLKFLRRCLKQIPDIDFLDPTTNKQYLQCRSGQFEIVDKQILENMLIDTEQKQLLTSIGAIS